MGTVFQALSLGITQGLTEFLPISSSAHLIIIPWLFKWPKHSLSFDVALHAGTLLAIIIYFGKYWLRLIKQGILSFGNPSLTKLPETRIFWLITAATVPGVIAGKYFAPKAETILRNPLLIGLTLTGFGILFFAIDRVGSKKRTFEEISISDACAIGLSQALAIVPGVSRSGITIICGLILGFNREAATKFSFLLSGPIILGATLFEAQNIAKIVNPHEGRTFLIGFFSSAMVGILAIGYLLNYVKKHNFNLFNAYRIVLGIIILIILFLRH
jgi:undecaprenyl-diphosphatase